ncbi:MAG: hypothetical protein IBJ03_16175 [Gemmatimonadaceae bacterium]|nr:hypothetical protein [Gemmatimonadaceae bacterium]
MSIRFTSPMTVGTALWLSVAGCSTERSDGQMTADLERDLAMAVYARPAVVVSAVEGGRTGAPSGDARGRRDAVPQPRRAARPAPAPEVQETTSDAVLDTPLPAISMAPTEISTEAAAPAPEIPAPSAEPSTTVIPVSGPSDASGREGHGREGHGRGGMGGVIGAIIRGGAAGDDNCEEHDRRRGRGRGRGPILTTGGGWGRGVGTVIMVGGAIISNTGDRGTVRPTFPR